MSEPECTICAATYDKENEPVTNYACKHVVCENCIGNMIDSKLYQSYIECPFCRAEWKIDWFAKIANERSKKPIGLAELEFLKPMRIFNDDDELSPSELLLRVMATTNVIREMSASEILDMNEGNHELARRRIPMEMRRIARLRDIREHRRYLHETGYRLVTRLGLHVFEPYERELVINMFGNDIIFQVPSTTTMEMILRSNVTMNMTNENGEQQTIVVQLTNQNCYIRDQMIMN